MIIMYTDGASRGNPGPGGYGVVMKYKQHRKEFSAGFRKTTNNRMELMAVIVGLEAIKEPGYDVTIYSDSKYVVDAIQQKWILGWQRKGFAKVKNPDLWQRFLRVFQKHRVKFVWVKGHAGNPENERCDQLAVQAATGPGLLIDEGYESNMANPLLDD